MCLVRGRSDAAIGARVCHLVGVSPQTPHFPPARSRARASRERQSDSIVDVPVPTRVSAYVVSGLALAALVVWTLPMSRWTIGPVTAAACVLLVAGWPRLSRVDTSPVVQIVVAVAGSTIPSAVAYWQNLDIAVALMGIALAVAVAATVLTAPAPRDRSVSPGDWSESASGAVANTVTLLLFIMGGSMWVSLTVLERWSVTVPVVAFAALVVVWGNQVGRSKRVQACVTVALGLVAGLVAAWGAWYLGRTAGLLPAVFPTLAERYNEFDAFLVFGGVTGTGVGGAIVVVDGLLGTRTRDQALIAVAARGAAKFLIAVLPVYAMVRISGV